MPPKQDIHSVAKQWVQRFGREALEQLEQRLVELREHGEHEAHDLWLKIYVEVQKLIHSQNTTD